MQKRLQHVRVYLVARVALVANRLTRGMPRKPSSWIGGVLLTRTRPTMHVNLVNRQVTPTRGRMEGRDVRADELGHAAQIGQGMDRVEWIHASDSVPD